MSNEVTDLIDALHEGRLTVEEVARRFRKRTWPRRWRASERATLVSIGMSTKTPSMRP